MNKESAGCKPAGLCGCVCTKSLQDPSRLACAGGREQGVADLLLHHPGLQLHVWHLHRQHVPGGRLPVRGGCPCQEPLIDHMTDCPASGAARGWGALGLWAFFSPAASAYLLQHQEQLRAVELWGRFSPAASVGSCNISSSSGLWGWLTRAARPWVHTHALSLARPTHCVRASDARATNIHAWITRRCSSGKQRLVCRGSHMLQPMAPQYTNTARPCCAWVPLRYGQCPAAQAPQDACIL